MLGSLLDLLRRFLRLIMLLIRFAATSRGGLGAWTLRSLPVLLMPGAEPVPAPTILGSLSVPRLLPALGNRGSLFRRPCFCASGLLCTGLRRGRCWLTAWFGLRGSLW